MARIVFSNLGRNQWNGSVPVKDNATADEVAEAAYKESLKHLGSRFPDSDYDASLNEGMISTGFHTVGTYKVEPNP